MNDKPLSPRERISNLFAELMAARKRVEPVEIPGWVIRAPAPSELDQYIVTMVVESNPGQHVPFWPPHNTEVVITVLEGRVRIESGPATFIGRKFFVLSASMEEHAVVPLTDQCKISAMFFRTGVTDGGEQSVAAR